jgi:hypothetical protein
MSRFTTARASYLGEMRAMILERARRCPVPRQSRARASRRALLASRVKTRA